MSRVGNQGVLVIYHNLRFLLRTRVLTTRLPSRRELDLTLESVKNGLFHWLMQLSEPNRKTWVHMHVCQIRNANTCALSLQADGVRIRVSPIWYQDLYEMERYIS